MTDQLEQVHCVIPKIYVFQIPPTTGVTQGHSARDWPKKAMWFGRLRVISKGDNASVLLEHLDKDGVFAVCPYNTPTAVEQVNDSSRYFVIRVEGQGGRSASVGIGFKERDEAFNFKIALQDASKQNSDKAEQYLSSLGPSQDFSLAEGETIHVNMGGKSEHHAGGDAEVGGPLMKLGPLGDGGKKKKKKKKKGVIGPEPVGTRTPVIRQAAGGAQPAVTSHAGKAESKKAASGVDELTDDLFSMSVAEPAPAVPVTVAKAVPAAASDNPFDVFDF